MKRYIFMREVAAQCAEAGGCFIPSEKILPIMLHLAIESILSVEKPAISIFLHGKILTYGK